MYPSHSQSGYGQFDSISVDFISFFMLSCQALILSVFHPYLFSICQLLCATFLMPQIRSDFLSSTSCIPSLPTTSNWKSSELVSITISCCSFSITVLCFHCGIRECSADRPSWTRILQSLSSCHFTSPMTPTPVNPTVTHCPFSMYLFPCAHVKCVFFYKRFHKSLPISQSIYLTQPALP